MLGGRTLTTPPGQSWTSTSSASTLRTKLSFVPPKHQLKLYGNAILPEANQQMHIAIAAFIHGSALPFSIARDPNFLHIIDITRNLGPRCTLPDQQMVSGRLLDLLYRTSFKGMMMTLLLAPSVKMFEIRQKIVVNSCTEVIVHEHLNELKQKPHLMNLIKV